MYSVIPLWGFVNSSARGKHRLACMVKHSSTESLRPGGTRLILTEPVEERRIGTFRRDLKVHALAALARNGGTDDYRLAAAERLLYSPVSHSHPSLIVRFTVWMDGFWVLTEMTNCGLTVVLPGLLFHVVPPLTMVLLRLQTSSIPLPSTDHW